MGMLQLLLGGSTIVPCDWPLVPRVCAEASKDLETAMVVADSCRRARAQTYSTNSWVCLS